MPSTIYRGDLAEISFGHESGLYLEFGKPDSLAFTITNSTTDDTATIAFSGANSSYFDSNQNLRYPEGMFVGAKLRIISGGRFDSDDVSTGAVFTIVSNTEDDIIITPRLKGGTATASSSGAPDAIIIDPLGVPSPDIDNNYMVWNATPKDSKESVLTDQFVGLVSNITLPETKVDIKRYQVVGLGRDVAVQAPGRYTHTGGSFEVNIHNARWFYYCLGTEVAKPSVTASAYAQNSSNYQELYVSGNISPGQNFIDVDFNSQFGTSFANVQHYNGGSTSDVTVGDYVYVLDEQDGTSNAYTLPVVQHREVDLANVAAANRFGSGSDTPHLTPVEATRRYEIRRIVGFETAGRIYLDDPLNLPHDGGTRAIKLRFMRFDSTTGNSSPDLSTTGATAGAITAPITRLIYSRSTLPSFALEASVRNRDIGSYSTEQDESVPSSANDSKQLTRIFKGCKVTSFTFTADTDAAARLQVNFDSQMVYTDTGRLHATESSRGDRFIAHRMFENTANTPAARKEAGIESGTQKPFFFYDGTLTIGDRAVARATSFTLTGNNNTSQIYTIGGNPNAAALSADTLLTDQVPFGGKHSPSDVVEGKTDYSLSMEVILDDPIFLHELRSAKSFNDKGDSIRLSFTKQGASGTREQMTIWLEDFMLSEAPIPIPEDKGAVRATLNILPKTMRVVATDTLGHS